jgi:hypothetical protein
VLVVGCPFWHLPHNHHLHYRSFDASHTTLPALAMLATTRSPFAPSPSSAPRAQPAICKDNGWDKVASDLADSKHALKRFGLPPLARWRLDEVVDGVAKAQQITEVALGEQKAVTAKACEERKVAEIRAEVAEKAAEEAKAAVSEALAARKAASARATTAEQAAKEAEATLVSAVASGKEEAAKALRAQQAALSQAETAEATAAEAVAAQGRMEAALRAAEQEADRAKAELEEGSREAAAVVNELDDAFEKAQDRVRGRCDRTRGLYYLSTHMLTPRLCERVLPCSCLGARAAHAQ